MKKRIISIALAILGVMILVVVLIATVPPLRAALPGIAQHVPAVGPASGLTLRVEGPSMEPEFKTGDTVNLVPLTDGHPQRCEVVAYHPSNAPDELFLKRVVALPGDTVSFLPGGGVLVNGNLPCPSVIHGNQTSSGSVTATLTANFYFVVGDNIQESNDSRVSGPVARSSIVGYLPG